MNLKVKSDNRVNMYMYIHSYKSYRFQGLIVRRDPLIIFLITNVNDMYLSQKCSTINFHVCFGTSINQENQFQSIPPYFMALIDPMFL